MIEVNALIVYIIYVYTQYEKKICSTSTHSLRIKLVEISKILFSNIGRTSKHFSVCMKKKKNFSGQDFRLSVASCQ